MSPVPNQWFALAEVGCRAHRYHTGGRVTESKRIRRRLATALENYFDKARRQKRTSDVPIGLV